MLGQAQLLGGAKTINHLRPIPRTVSAATE
jgi:hypothetical protein